ncbi:MAG: hypothetical protein IPJ19_09640 [Planctomycetes bacterium]|nr:hypothetical protein [Planctomycetota bacterium]
MTLAAPAHAHLTSRTPPRFLARASALLLTAIAVSTGTGMAVAQVTERVSVTWTGAQAWLGGDLPATPNAVSADGRFVLFMSPSNDIVPNDTNSKRDIFVRDRLDQSVERVSVGSGGTQSNGDSGIYGMSMSPDARFVVFASRATNLAAQLTSGADEIFLRDRLNGTTELVSVDSNGLEANGSCAAPAVSDDGLIVAFYSSASNLVPGDTNSADDVFAHDRITGITERISVSSSGVQALGGSGGPYMSGDGRFVAFTSYAGNLVQGGNNFKLDAFLRDRILGTTELMSPGWTGASGNGDSYPGGISADGRYVCFSSSASNLVPNDTNHANDVFIRDRRTATTELVSVSGAGVPFLGGGGSVLSPDGRFVAFGGASTLSGPIGLWFRDRQLGTTEYTSYCYDGSLPDYGIGAPSISPDARYLVFRSLATNIVAGDTNGFTDVFLRDRFASGFTSLCDPLDPGVADCPCNNPPALPGRGCGNSSHTGGALLSAEGIAYLSQDTLSFATRGEGPHATSILLAGDSLLPGGVAFGQGVRCVGGNLLRFFVKTALNGSIRAPDLAAGDPTISARSSQLGVTLPPGETRVFLVYYRDPIVLGGCGAALTFNATQSGAVVYWP